MRRITAIAAGVFLAIAGAPTSALASSPALKTKYSNLYHVVQKRHGKRTPGRNIRAHGIKTKHGSRPATDRELARSIRTFRRWLAPPVAPVAAGDRSPVGTIAAAPAKAGGQYSIPRYIVMCESGGDYSKYNSAGSGASGAYQIMPGTWKAYGGSTANAADASPAEQDRIAAKIYAAEGASPWDCG